MTRPALNLKCPLISCLVKATASIQSLQPAQLQPKWGSGPGTEEGLTKHLGRPGLVPEGTEGVGLLATSRQSTEFFRESLASTSSFVI